MAVVDPPMQSPYEISSSLPLIPRTNSDLQRVVKPGNTHEFLCHSVSSRLKGKINA